MRKARTERPCLYSTGAIINGRYRVVRRRGYGGTAEVYEVEEINLYARLAIKVVHLDLVATPAAREHIMQLMSREARVGAQLRSRTGKPGVEGIAWVTELGVTQDAYRLPFFAMELLEGHTLYTRMIGRREARDPFRIPHVLRLAEELVKVVLFLHDDGLVHCDLKPDNIFLHRGASHPVLKLLDLGMMVHDGEVLAYFRGTPRYAAPEQFLGRPLRFSTDTYAIGCILYEMITGRGPFDSPDAPLNDDELRRAHLEEPVPPMRSFRDDLPDALDDLVRSMLRKEPTASDPKRPLLREVAQEISRLLTMSLAVEGRDRDDAVRDLRDEVSPAEVSDPAQRPLVLQGRGHAPMVAGDHPPGALTAPVAAKAPSQLLIALSPEFTTVGARASREATIPGIPTFAPSTNEGRARAADLDRTDPDPKPFFEILSDAGSPSEPNTTQPPGASLPHSAVPILVSRIEALGADAHPAPLPQPASPSGTAAASPTAVPGIALSNEPAIDAGDAAGVVESSRSLPPRPEPAGSPRNRFRSASAFRTTKAPSDGDDRWGDSPYAELHQEPYRPLTPPRSILREARSPRELGGPTTRGSLSNNAVARERQPTRSRLDRLSWVVALGVFLATSVTGGLVITFPMITNRVHAWNVSRGAPPVLWTASAATAPPAETASSSPSRSQTEAVDAGNDWESDGGPKGFRSDRRWHEANSEGPSR